LTLPRHWRRAASRLVRVTGTDAEVFEGRVVDSDDTAVRLDVNGHVREVPYEQVAKAVVQVEFPKEAL
jgi:ribosome maturation factor RimP